MTTSETSDLSDTAAPRPPSGTDEPAPSAGPLLLVLAGTFITVLDFFIVNVAAPSIQGDLHASPAAIQFTIAGYGLAFAALMITSGRMGDLYGRRKMFTAGLALFTLASAASGLAQNPGELVGARVVQGVAAALLTPQVLAILGSVYTGKHRANAFNAYGLTIGIAGVFGQLIGGALIAANIGGSGWRAIFLINVPIGLIALAFVGKVVPESRGEGRTGLDLVGTVLVTLGLVAVVLPLVQGREQGWPTWSIVSLVAALPLLALFGLHQRALGARGRSPLIDVSLFRERAFSVGLLCTLGYYSAMGSCFLVLSLYLQQGHGLSALGSGLVYVPMGVGFFLSSAMAPKLVGALGRQVLAVGAVLVAVGYTALSEIGTAIGTTGSVWWLVPALVVSGFGMGMVMAPLSSTVLERVAPHHAASASGALSTAQEIGGALGVALVGIIFFGVVGDPARAFGTSLYLLIGFAVAVALLVQLLPKAQQAEA
ncbi:MFS transporter [Actinokineospora sp. NBRC 105648]|uniref:MFS transporter n=1 Tax=Actinokineospora sp. NBRC 105648 TaxID=3032206 RepID=UPI0024A5EB93|nr:MFS transporter [Actinokineospora sp. NBRC 105648]GLZ40734.1 MFS transporter [Actinokineospora sp. NBRC 105648]